jgi:hypothetical protein
MITSLPQSYFSLTGQELHHHELVLLGNMIAETDDAKIHVILPTNQMHPASNG